MLFVITFYLNLSATFFSPILQLKPQRFLVYRFSQFATQLIIHSHCTTNNIKYQISIICSFMHNFLF